MSVNERVAHIAVLLSVGSYARSVRGQPKKKVLAGQGQSKMILLDDQKYKGGGGDSAGQGECMRDDNSHKNTPARASRATLDQSHRT